MNKRLWIVLAILVVATIGGLVWWRSAQSGDKNYVDYLDGTTRLTSQNISDAKNKAANGGQIAQNFKASGTIIPDHYLGKTDSKVVVVEYEDFACSACIALSPYAAKIHDDYKDRVLFIYRNFNLGQNTSTLSESAAEAAYLIGGDTETARETTFWQMHDLLFSDQTCMEGNDKNTCQNKIMSYAAQLKFDITKFTNGLNDFTTNGVQDKIQRDKALGLAAGVNATPTWFVNGKKIQGANDSTMRSAIDGALKNAK